MGRVALVFRLQDGSVGSWFVIIVTVSSHTIFCIQGGSTHLVVGMIAVTSLCTTA